MIPPSFPRIPYLFPPPGGASDDRTLTTTEASQWLRRDVVVEEKLDGANVAVWLDDGALEVASRGGVDAMDRSRQLGRLRAWCAERDEALRLLLGGGLVMYGEWMWLRHSLRYTRLSDWLVVLDLWRPDRGFLPADVRDDAVAPLGLVVPPQLFKGVLGEAAAVRALCGSSAFVDAPAEGVVIRSGQDRCKVVADTFVRRNDADWDVQAHNQVGVRA